MRKDIEKKLIEVIATTEVGENILSISKMTKSFNCSRGLLQNILQEFEQAGYITTSKSLSGTTLIDINYTELAAIYFDSISVSASLYANSITNERLTERVLQEFEPLEHDTYLTFSDSSLHRLELLFNNKVEFALVTDSYFNSLESSNLLIYRQYELKSTIHTKLIISDNSNLEYNIDEVPKITLDETSNTQTPSKYYLICLKHTATLFPYISK